MNKEGFDKERAVSKEYLKYREQVIKYTYQDMNLELENDKQVYIAVFDMPLKSDITGFQTQTLALVYGLNTHIYHGSGRVIVGMEKNKNIMKAMQSLLISSHQVLNVMEITENIDFYNSNKIRAYLKTRKGIYFRELAGNCKEDEFLSGLINYVLHEIAESRRGNV